MKRFSLLSLLILFTLLALGYPTPVAAHAELVDADPLPGAQLSVSPTEIRLTFSEPLQPGSTLILYGGGFQEITGITVEIDSQFNEQLSAVVPVLDPSDYTVQWTAVTEDGGKTNGSYSFNVLAAGAGRSWWLAAIAVTAFLLLVGWAWRRREIQRQESLVSMRRTLLKIGLPLLVIATGVGGFFTIRHWSLIQRSPENITLDYVRSVYARDYARAWEFISSEEKQFKSRLLRLLNKSTNSRLRKNAHSSSS